MMIFEKYIFILFFMLVTTTSFGQSTKKTIPAMHPRVYINSNDILELIRKTQIDEFCGIWKEIKKNNHPFARAFRALLTGDDEMAAKAASDFLPLLQACTDARIPYNEMQLGACIYDWCYYQIDSLLKQAYIKEFKRIASGHAPFYPAQKGHGAVIGHNTEGWILSDQLPAGIAIYDEDPVMYDSASLVFFDEFVPLRNFVYQSNMHHQGDSYGSVRFLHDLFAAWLYRKMDIEAFSSDMQYVPYQLLYNYRPDGQQMRDGDTFDDKGNDAGGRSRAVNHKGLSLLLCGSLFNDPYLLEMFKKYQTSGLEKIFEFIITPAQKETKPLHELPLAKYFNQPMGEIIARTGWDMNFDSKDAIIQMRIGGYFLGNHQTKDFGTFQIYFKGPLAIASGAYQGIGETYGQPHWLNYHHQTISKNGLLIFDPDENIYKGSVNDGGQRWPNKGEDRAKNLENLLDARKGYKMAEVNGRAIGPDPVQPVFSYISGDITAAYAPQKVRLVQRSMLTIHTGDENFPALFYMFDQVFSTNKEFKKSWLIHSIQEPEVMGDLITIIRDEAEFSGKGYYAGKLYCKTILPKNPRITKIGGEGKGFWIENAQANYFIKKEDPASEEGAWRVEVSPDSAREEDLFFHAMVVTQLNNPQKCVFNDIRSEKLKGVAGMGYTVLFNPEIQLSTEFEFNLDKNMRGVFIGRAEPGWYEIRKEGTIVDRKNVTVQAKSLFLQNMGRGNYLIKKY